MKKENQALFGAIILYLLGMGFYKFLGVQAAFGYVLALTAYLYYHLQLKENE
jgi:hypothetical protein|tara:strand:+ start:2307 stop:2462 length:156 start_codon:yes stop_codon:yes gene_type:complete